jgi:lantibiotic modifying enzyme
MIANGARRRVFLHPISPISIGLIWLLGVTSGPEYAFGHAEGKFTDAEKAAFKTYIDQIAGRLVKDATKKERGIGWINTSSEGKPEESLDFYTGDSGVCYFLLKAYAVTRRKEYLDAAGQGMDYILSQGKSDEKGFYFRDGHNGVFEKNYVKWYHEELARQTRYSSQWCHGAPG